jgi:hypothetical protein
MNSLYAVMFFGVAFFGFMVVVGVVKARRKKEKAYYISAVLSFLMLLSCIFVILNQFVLVLALFVVMGVLSVAGLPRMTQALRRESLQELQETDLSAPLRLRELLIWKGWFKLASRWGVRKTMYFYSLIMTGVGGAMLCAFSFLMRIHIAWAIGYTIIVGILSAIFFHRQVGEALKRGPRRKKSAAQMMPHGD